MNPLVLIIALALGAEEVDGTQEADRPTVIIVVGAPGVPEYGEQFHRWADRWQQAAEQSGAQCLRIGETPASASSAAGDTEQPDRERLESLLLEEPKQSAAPLWLVLIGHGTFDGSRAMFCLRGPDVTAAVMAEWLAPYERPVVVINCASSSAPFINRLSGPNRVIVSATKSGYEQNYARFGDFMSTAITETSADLDKDEQTSLLEAFLWASGRTAEFYRQEARLATETALVDDNADGLGTPAAWFRGIRPTRQAKDSTSLDGSSAHRLHLIPSRQERDMPAQLRARRDELERAIVKLRQSRGDAASEDEYYGELERLLVELARLYARSKGSGVVVGESKPAEK